MTRWFNEQIRGNRFFALLVINLRFLIGFGFLPSGLKKGLGIPFANPGQAGAFMEYLDALYATGFYYEFIGWAQVIAAVLLITQRFAALGAALFLPIILNIVVFTHSTIGTLTPWIASLMFLGIVFLLLWDYEKWANILLPEGKVKVWKTEPTQTTASKFWVNTSFVFLLSPALVLGLSAMFGWNESHGNIIGIFLLLFMILLVLGANVWNEIAFRKALKKE